MLLLLTPLLLRCRFIFVYGMLCYKLLGDEAQTSFARSWGVSYGVGAAAEWKARWAFLTISHSYVALR